MSDIFEKFKSLPLYSQFSDYGDDDSNEKCTKPLAANEPSKAGSLEEEVTPAKKGLTLGWQARRSQDLVIGSSVLSSFPFPLRQPRKDLDKDYERTVNGLTYKLISSREHGYPCGQDPLVLLLLEDLARKSGSRKIYIDSVWSVLKKIGLGDGKQNYLRFEAAIKRLAHSKFCISMGEDTGLFFDLFDAIHLKGITENWDEAKGNFVIFTEAHFKRIQQEETPEDLGVLCLLSHSSGAQRLYRFVAKRSFASAQNKEGVVRISAASLLNQLGAEEYKRVRKQKEMLKIWKKECDEALLELGIGHLPLDINDSGVVSIFPKHLLPGVPIEPQPKQALPKPKRSSKKVKEFDLDWVLEKEIEDFNSGITSSVSHAASKYMSEKLEATGE